MSNTKRVGKAKGVTDANVIVAQKQAEKAAAQAEAYANNPLRQVYRDGVNVSMDGKVFRSLINAILFIQQDNMTPNYIQDPETGEEQVVSYSHKMGTEPIMELAQGLLSVHMAAIEAGDTVDIEVLRDEHLAQQQAQSKMTVAAE
jgi:hypothetical protein